ncbi:unnamed protein product [Symbiodinium sp. CCMP2592]|nr:unnamed protein product [Symbiodinium sp. CCMP2592]
MGSTCSAAWAFHQEFQKPQAMREHAVFGDVETGFGVNGKRQGFNVTCANPKQAGGGHLAEPEELHGYLVILALVSPASGPDKALLQPVNKLRGGSSFGLFGPAQEVEAELGLLISKQHAPGTVPPRAGPPSLQRTSSATAPKSLGGSVAIRLYKGWMLGQRDHAETRSAAAAHAIALRSRSFCDDARAQAPGCPRFERGFHPDPGSRFLALNANRHDAGHKGRGILLVLRLESVHDAWNFGCIMPEAKGIPAPWKDRWTLPGATLHRRGSALLGELSLRDLEDLFEGDKSHLSQPGQGLQTLIGEQTALDLSLEVSSGTPEFQTQAFPWSSSVTILLAMRSGASMLELYEQAAAAVLQEWVTRSIYAACYLHFSLLTFFTEQLLPVHANGMLLEALGSALQSLEDGGKEHVVASAACLGQVVLRDGANPVPNFCWELLESLLDRFPAIPPVVDKNLDEARDGPGEEKLLAFAKGLQSWWLTGLPMSPVERLGLLEQITAFVTALALSESRSFWPCYRGHLLLPLIPRFHESLSPFAWPSLGGSKKVTDVVLLSAAPQPKQVPKGPPVLLRAATALQANWADAVRDLRETAGRLAVHGDELLRSVREAQALVQEMHSRSPSEAISKAALHGAEVSLEGVAPKIEAGTSRQSGVTVRMMTMRHLQEWQGAAAEAMNWVTQEDVRQKAGTVLSAANPERMLIAGASGHLPEHSSSLERGWSKRARLMAARLDESFSFDLQMPSTSSTVASVSTLQIATDMISGEVQDIANFGGTLRAGERLLVSACSTQSKKGYLYLLENCSGSPPKCSVVVSEESSVGCVDGALKDALFGQLALGLCGCEDGSFLVADISNHRIRRVSKTLEVKAVAGSGSKGQKDGPVASATFSSPRALISLGDTILVTEDGHPGTVRVLEQGLVDSITIPLGRQQQQMQESCLATDACDPTSAWLAHSRAVCRVSKSSGSWAVETIVEIQGITGLTHLWSPDGSTDGLVLSKKKSYTLSFWDRTEAKKSLSIMAGQGASRGSVDGLGTEARLAGPGKQCVLGDGSLLVADGRGLRRIVTQALRESELARAAESVERHSQLAMQRNAKLREAWEQVLKVLAGPCTDIACARRAICDESFDIEAARSFSRLEASCESIAALVTMAPSMAAALKVLPRKFSSGVAQALHRKLEKYHWPPMVQALKYLAADLEALQQLAGSNFLSETAAVAAVDGPWFSRQVGFSPQLVGLFDMLRRCFPDSRPLHLAMVRWALRRYVRSSFSKIAKELQERNASDEEIARAFTDWLSGILQSLGLELEPCEEQRTNSLPWLVEELLLEHLIGDSPDSKYWALQRSAAVADTLGPALRRLLTKALRVLAVDLPMRRSLEALGLRIDREASEVPADTRGGLKAELVAVVLENALEPSRKEKAKEADKGKGKGPKKPLSELQDVLRADLLSWGCVLRWFDGVQEHLPAELRGRLQKCTEPARGGLALLAEAAQAGTLPVSSVSSLVSSAGDALEMAGHQEGADALRTWHERLVEANVVLQGLVASCKALWPNDTHLLMAVGQVAEAWPDLPAASAIAGLQGGASPAFSQVPSTLLVVSPALSLLGKSSAFRALWWHEGCGAGRFEPAELQLSAIAWAGFYSSLQAPEASELPLPALEPVLGRLQDAEELRLMAVTGSTLQLSDGKIVAWDTSDPSAEWEAAAAELARKLWHSLSVKQSHSALQKTLSGLREKLLDEKTGQKEADEVLDVLVQLQGAFQSWETTALKNHGAIGALTAQIDARLLIHPEAMMTSMLTSFEMLQWLRKMPDDSDYLVRIEVALNRSEMEVPAELWLAEEGRVDESKLSALTAPLSCSTSPDDFQLPVDPLVAMTYQSADVVAALDMVRRAVASGDDLSQLFSEWSGLERRALVEAINSPGAAPGPVVYGDSSRGLPSSSSTGAGMATSSPSDPHPEPPVDRQQAPPPAQAGVPGVAASPADLPPAGMPSGGYPQKPTRPAPSVPKGSPPQLWDQLGFLCRADAVLAYNHNIPSADAFYRRYSTVLPDRITPATVIPAAPPATPPVPQPADYQARIAEELRQQFAEESRQTGTVAPQVKAMPAAPAPPPSSAAPSGASRRARTPTPQEMYPDADPVTGAGFPMLPRRPRDGAPAAEFDRHKREYRQVVHIRRMLCSAAWRDHVAAVNLVGARTDVELPESLQPLAVANLEHLEDLEHNAGGGTTAMVPASAAAAYYVLRALPHGVRGGRIPEKIPGEIWCAGWCGHPCTNRLCRGIPGRCLRPVVIRAGGAVDLVGGRPRRYFPVAVFYMVDLTDGLGRIRAVPAPPAQEKREAVGDQSGWLEAPSVARFSAHLPVMGPRRGSHAADFGQLVRAFVELGAPEHLPLLPTLGAVDVESALARASALVAGGVPATVLESLASWRSRQVEGPPVEPARSLEGPRSAGPAPSTQLVPARPTLGTSATAIVPAAGHASASATGSQAIPSPATVSDRPAEKRRDIPARRDVRRACKRTALEAALPENRAAALAEIDENILAKSSQAPFQSRVRSWVEACETWAVDPWPISADAVRKVAASFRRGGYRSVQNYFDAAVSYQEQFRGEAVDPLIRRAMRRYSKAVVRGMPGSKLKAIFSVDSLVALVVRVDPPGSGEWSPWVTAHAVDALILAVWFMLREIEFSAARTQDIDVADGTVALRLPLHKTATGGEVELTMRQLRCACGAVVAPLCPYHAALRHVSRLRRAGRWVRGAPLFPDGTGETWEKSAAILFFRRVLLAAGIQLTTTDHTGATVQLFNGHLARVAGAAWLASKGVNTPIIQLLGRWSSAAVERYVQAAPLALAPDVPRHIDEVEIVSVRPAYGAAVSSTGAAAASSSRPPLALADGDPAEKGQQPGEEHSPTVTFEPGPVRPETVREVAVAPPEHLIYNERQKRAHAPDPAEASITELPVGAAKCLRCFPKTSSADGEGSPTEEESASFVCPARRAAPACRGTPQPFSSRDRTARLLRRYLVIMAHGPHLVADALTDFDDLATSAGAGPDLVEYLRARSLNRTATLALVADEWSDVDARVFQPFRDGDEIAGKTYRAAPAEQPVVRAIIRHMWSEARRQWNEFSAPPPAPATATPPPPALPTLAGEKPPRTFPEWTDLVARYNAVQLGGEPRSFPAERLVGAEEVLARIHWEHTKSKLYTPLGLGEILATRTWSSLGVVNPLTSRRGTGATQNIKFVDGGPALSLASALAAVLPTAAVVVVPLVLAATAPGLAPGLVFAVVAAGLLPAPVVVLISAPVLGGGVVLPVLLLASLLSGAATGLSSVGGPRRLPRRAGLDGGLECLIEGGLVRHDRRGDLFSPGQTHRHRQLMRRGVPVGHDGLEPVRVEAGLGRPPLDVADDAGFGAHAGQDPGPADGVEAVDDGPNAPRDERLAPALVENLFGQPVLAMAWETDATCRRLASVRLPWLVHRGDVTAESPGSVAAAVRKADPDDRREALRRRVAFLFENVIMEPADAAKVSESLGVKWISRPRLWWLSADLESTQVDPATGLPLVWAKHGSYRRLRLDATRQPSEELTEGGLSFHQSVESGRIRLPCSTTPAEEAGGRPPPKRDLIYRPKSRFSTLDALLESLSALEHSTEISGLVEALDFAFSLLGPLSELLGGKDAALARMLQMLKPTSCARWVLCYPRLAAPSPADDKAQEEEEETLAQTPAEARMLYLMLSSPDAAQASAPQRLVEILDFQASVTLAASTFDAAFGQVRTFNEQIGLVRLAAAVLDDLRVAGHPDYQEIHVEWPLSLGLSEMKSQLHGLRERQGNWRQNLISAQQTFPVLGFFAARQLGCLLNALSHELREHVEEVLAAVASTWLWPAQAEAWSTDLLKHCRLQTGAEDAAALLQQDSQNLQALASALQATWMQHGAERVVRAPAAASDAGEVLGQLGAGAHVALATDFYSAVALLLWPFLARRLRPAAWEVLPCHVRTTPESVQLLLLRWAHCQPGQFFGLLLPAEAAFATQQIVVQAVHDAVDEAGPLPSPKCPLLILVCGENSAQAHVSTQLMQHRVEASQPPANEFADKVVQLISVGDAAAPSVHVGLNQGGERGERPCSLARIVASPSTSVSLFATSPGAFGRATSEGSLLYGICALFLRELHANELYGLGGGDLVKHTGENDMATGAGLEMQVDHQGNSPVKRRAPDKPDDLALNIDIIREAIRGELKDALSDVKQDLRSFATRVDNVESQVTRKMQQTINLLDDMTTKYASHGDILQQLQEANKEVNFRLERLEKGGGASSVAGSTATSDNSRRPALIVGGWDPDQDATTTKEAVADVLKTVDAPIALDSLFVPGVRRGYAILPIDDRMGEHFDQRKQRIQEVIAKVRDANIQLGRRADGGIKRVWIAMSQPPDRRRRARLAAKVKRLYLTLGGAKDALQMEFSTGTAWINSTKVCSATAPKPGGTEDAGPGWVNLEEIAKATRTTQQAVSTAWSPLKAEIN